MSTKIDLIKFVSLERLARFLENIKKIFVQKEVGKGLSENDLTNDLKSNYNAAYTHSGTAHAPSDAQANVLNGIKVNSVALTINNKTVNVIVPTKVSDLENDSEYLTEHPEVDTIDDTETETTPGSGGTFTAIDTVTRDDNGHVKTLNVKTITLPDAYTHPTSSVSAGTYRSVTVNQLGHITAGSNPTSRDGYGLTDVPTTDEMDTAIATKVAEADHMKKEIVEVLPAVGEANELTIYLILKEEAEEQNIYDEYMLINGAFEKIGDTALSLEGYLHEDDIVEITEQEIDALFA